ncbi:MAG: hypothetical protein ACKVXR_03090 [Planctomycetota bacterium]
MIMIRRPKLSCAALLLGLACTACGDRPERIGKESATPSTPHAPPAPAEARFEGRIVLEGATEATPGAAVFVSARRIGQRLPALSRKYDLASSAWAKDGDKRILMFQLTDRDNMGGVASPMAAEMEIEARFDPDGFIDPSPGAQEEGVVRSAVPASPGSKGIEVVLRLDASK